VTWLWMDGQWSFKVVGSFSPGPNDLQLDGSQIQWTGQVSPVTKVSLYISLYALSHFLALYNIYDRSKDWVSMFFFFSV